MKIELTPNSVAGAAYTEGALRLRRDPGVWSLEQKTPAMTWRSLGRFGSPSAAIGHLLEHRSHLLVASETLELREYLTLLRESVDRIVSAIAEAMPPSERKTDPAPAFEVLDEDNDGED